MTTDTKLGFIGLSTERGWAKTAHLPALHGIDHNLYAYKITGIANTSIDSSESSKEEHCLKEAETFKSVDELAKSDHVDTVVVTVRVPEHYDIIATALELKKDVISEWPLANGAKEAELLAKLAKSNDVKTGVVLQARKSPVIIKAKELVESGAIGRIISSNMIARTSNWGQFFERNEKEEYALSDENGANLLTIVGGHNLDALAYVLGEFEFLNAILKNQFEEVEIIETQELKKTEIQVKTDVKEKTDSQKKKDTPDQVLVQGVLKSGAVASVHIRGEQLSDISREESFKWEIHGSKGDIVIKAVPGFYGSVIQKAQNGLSQMNKLSIKVSQLDDQGNSKGIQDYSLNYNPVVDNVKMFYESYAKTEKGKHVVPQLDKVEGFTTFEDAVIRHREIEAIVKASQTGSRQYYNADTSNL
jgi:predicted dehydrogenase